MREEETTRDYLVQTPEGTPVLERDYLKAMQEFYGGTREGKLIGNDSERRRFVFFRYGKISVTSENGLARLTLNGLSKEFGALLELAERKNKFKLLEVAA